MPSYAKEDLLAAVRALSPPLRAASEEIEAQRTLPEPIVQAMVDAGLYHLFLPRSLGGGELDPLTYFDVIEALTQAETAAAWSVSISTGGMAASIRGLPDQTLSAMFASPRDAVMAGSAPPRGRAVPAPGGYRVTGRWSQGSNILIARWVQAGCRISDGDKPLPGPDGKAVYLTCIFPASEAAVADTWRTTGMRGTGSHDFAVTGLFVPEERAYVDARERRRPQPLYRFPGWTQVAHAAIGLGIARVAIEQVVGLAGGKRATWLPSEGTLADRATIQAKVAQAEALVGSGRAYVREATANLWETVCRQQRPSPQQRAVYRLAIAQAMANAVQAVDLMYGVAGVSAIYSQSPLDRCLRDAHTAAAHVWVSADTYELAGRLLLGLDPRSRSI